MSSSSETHHQGLQLPLLITIDGPAGSGKTTVSRLLAIRLGYHYVDTGALYRCIALEAHKKAIETTDDRQLQKLCADLTISFRETNGRWRLFSNDNDVTEQIRTPEVSMLASAISAMPSVRQHLLGVQRKLGEKKSVVFEGRDMGTVVFPEADLKFYLDADIAVRAQRRFREQDRQHVQTKEDVEADMIRRDHHDSHRELSPLKPAHDAVLIDTTRLSIDAVVQTMLIQVKQLSHP